MNKVKEDKDTYVKFYKMKQDLLPTKVMVYVYALDEFIKWRPTARENCTINYIGTVADSHRFYIYSGLSNVALNEMVQLSVDDENGSTSWKKLDSN